MGKIEKDKETVEGLKVEEKKIRLGIIDQLLAQGRPISFQDAALALNEEFKKCKSEKSFLAVYGDSFRKDINTIKDVIAQNRTRGIREDMLQTRGSNRYKRYWYIEQGFSIMPFLQYYFTKADFEMLDEALDSLKIVLPSDIYNKVEFSLKSRIEYDFGRREKSIDYGENLNLRGRHWLPIIYKSLNKVVLDIRYKPYYDDTYSFKLCPYLLKQYNNRWFLFGRIDEIKRSFWKNPQKDIEKIDPNYWIVPVDRIEDVSVCEGEEMIPRPNNYMDRFAPLIGIHQQEYGNKTILPGEIQTIILNVYNINTWGQLTTKPLHSTMKVLKDFNNGSGQIQIEIIPNIEFYNKLMELGENVVVESPIKVREIIKKRLQDTLKKYENEG